jgi:hypothetical protein
MTGINYNFSSTGNGTTALTHGSGSANNSLELPLTNGVLVSTGDTNSVSNSMLAGSIAQSKLVQPGWKFTPATGVDIVPRTMAALGRSLASGVAYFVAFIPDTTITVSSLEFSTTTAASANATTPTHKFNAGIFTVNAGGTKPTSLTCQTWGQRNSTTTTMAAFGSLTGTQSFALGYTVTNGTSATNGAPTSITLNAGTTYWIGIHPYANASFAIGATIGGFACTAYQFDPYIGLANSSQSSTDFAVSTNVSTLAVQSNAPFVRLNP